MTRGKARNRVIKPKAQPSNGEQPETVVVPLTDRQVALIQARLAERQEVVVRYDQQIAQMVDSMIAGHDVDFERVAKKALDLGAKHVTLTLGSAG
jgi:hypothetical protein